MELVAFPFQKRPCPKCAALMDSAIVDTRDPPRAALPDSMSKRRVEPECIENQACYVVVPLREPECKAISGKRNDGSPA
jgi:hypothetical protein